MMWLILYIIFIKNPKISAVYNIGGGYKNSISLLESIEKIESLTNIKMNFLIKKIQE